jgi:predicted RNA-binding Zn-ribbon protein involved in translation (DUF1610 family)
MKIRNGFVSNSSSSSFCIIGVGNGWVAQLAEAEGKHFECFDDYEDVETKKVRNCSCDIDPNKGKYCPECGNLIWGEEEVERDEPEYDDLGYGCCSGKVVDFYGNDEPSISGIDAEKLLQTMTIPEACRHFQKVIKEKFGIDIPLKAIKFECGECGNG